jgi:hypothetical protein
MKIISLIFVALAILAKPGLLAADDIDCMQTGCEVCHRTLCKLRMDDYYNWYDGYFTCISTEGIQELPMARCEEYYNDGYNGEGYCFLKDSYYYSGRYYSDYRQYGYYYFYNGNQYEGYEFYNYDYSPGYYNDCQGYCEDLLKYMMLSNEIDPSNYLANIEQGYNVRLIDYGDPLEVTCNDNDDTTYLVQTGTPCNEGFYKLSKTDIQNKCPSGQFEHLEAKSDNGKTDYGNYKVSCTTSPPPLVISGQILALLDNDLIYHSYNNYQRNEYIPFDRIAYFVQEAVL